MVHNWLSSKCRLVIHSSVLMWHARPQMSHLFWCDMQGHRWAISFDVKCKATEAICYDVKCKATDEPAASFDATCTATNKPSVSMWHANSEMILENLSRISRWIYHTIKVINNITIVMSVHRLVLFRLPESNSYDTKVLSTLCWTRAHMQTSSLLGICYLLQHTTMSMHF